MPYTIHTLAQMAGITVRTLHHYDEIGLLKPASIKQNGYRQYEEKELLRLQQIMFFRELEFPLLDIKKILASAKFDMQKALRDHRRLIELKKKRMDELLKTIDNTIKKINKEKNMDDKDLYTGFSKEQAEAYSKEAKERWGNTEAYKQSAGKYEKLTSDQKKQMKEAGERLMMEIVAAMPTGPKSPETQALIAKHYDALRFFYEPNLELYRNLGTMYVDDKRFAAYYERFDPKLPEFMRDAMYEYCDKQS